MMLSTKTARLQFVKAFLENCAKKPLYNRQASKGDTFMTHENTLQYGLRSIRYSGAKSWNEIPHIIKLSPLIMIFRFRLNLHLFSTKY